MGELGRRRLQARAEVTRERLLDATLHVLVERGYAGASTPEICRRAGLSRGAQLHHFPTKAELMAAAVEHLFRTRHFQFRASLPKSGDAREHLDAVFEAMWEIYSGATLYAWMELVVAARTDPALQELVAQVDAAFFAEARETFRALFANAGRTDVEMDGALRLLLSVFDGLALHNVFERDEAVLANVFAALKEMVRPWLK